MALQIKSLVHESLEGRLLLAHPFYRRWEAGELSEDELARYAGQDRYFEAYLPEFLEHRARTSMKDWRSVRCSLIGLFGFRGGLETQPQTIAVVSSSIAASI